MIAFVEATCIEAVRPFLVAGQHSVGTQVNITHQAATPVGMRVTTEVELTSVDKRMLQFHVICRDDVGVIAVGTRGRAVIDFERLGARLELKRASAGSSQSIG